MGKARAKPQAPTKRSASSPAHLRNPPSRKATLAFAIIFIVYILLRIFCASPYYYIAGDEGRYLGLVKSFPAHTLDGDHVRFLQHGPTFPYAIALLNFITHNDLLSGIIISFASAIAVFFVFIKFFRLLGKSDTWICLFLGFFALSETFITLSTIVYYESLYLLLFMLSATYFLDYLKTGRAWSFAASLLCGALFAYGTDKAVFLIPLLVLLWWFYAPNKRDWLPYANIIAICAVYGIVILIRLSWYTSHTYLPIGVDGLIEDVSHFGVSQLISPFSFAEGQKYAHFGFSINPLQMTAALAYLINIVPANIPVLLNKADLPSILNMRSLLLAIFIYLPIVFFIIRGLLRQLRKGESKLFLLFGIVALAPIFTGLANNRHMMLLAIPLYAFFAEGAHDKVSRLFPRGKAWHLAILAVVVLAFFLPANHSYSFTRQKFVQGQTVASYLNALPGQSVFVQTGYSMEQEYLTSKYVYGLVSEPGNMLFYINYFNISYVVLGSKTWTYTNEPSIPYVKTHPEQFKLLATFNETYPFNEPSDEFFVYEVRRPLPPTTFTAP